ncbi:MAG: hypothetical protein ACFFBD_23535 [Candidatus Hodarchaeota archaeon]
MEDRIRETAEQVIRINRENLGITLGYDEESVAWVDGHIELIKEDSLDQETLETLICLFGAYLGECICHQFGGHWKMAYDQWVISFPIGVKSFLAFPFVKVEKQFLGNQDSILGYFIMISAILDLWRY